MRRVIEAPSDEDYFSGWKEIAAALGCSSKHARRLSRTSDPQRRLEVRYGIGGRVWSYRKWVADCVERHTKTAEQRAAGA